MLKEDKVLITQNKRNKSCKIHIGYNVDQKTFESSAVAIHQAIGRSKTVSFYCYSKLLVKGFDFSHKTVVLDISRCLIFMDCAFINSKFKKVDRNLGIFIDCDFSRAVGLHTNSEWIKKYCETTPEGIICYKTFNGSYKTPKTWKVQPNSVISENVCMDRSTDCGCGVNVANTTMWVANNYNLHVMWKCLIPWEYALDICVPMYTNGKFRAGTVKLLENLGYSYNIKHKPGIYCRPDGKWWAVNELGSYWSCQTRKEARELIS